MLKQIAFALTRTRHAAWWLPKWLERRLPALDIEGDRLGPAPAPAVPESVPLTPSTAD
ncbi:hypothetical protein [Streptomyces olivochromogenes]|uniref:Uncharacterized protein n=1 Tax=Streptomyces olivochromogenes TaxID=1963 RepID=A0A250V4R6_STROL|nr:hypothetical protein [Streptomyces olivochromogenes]GAX49178.1 hypothetical protein SO3561_00666 [Streptomyces olivochromogenes]